MEIWRGELCKTQFSAKMHKKQNQLEGVEHLALLRAGRHLGLLGGGGEAAGGQAGVPGTWEELAGGRCAICTVQNTVSAKKRMTTNRKNGERAEGLTCNKRQLDATAATDNGGGGG